MRNFLFLILGALLFPFVVSAQSSTTVTASVKELDSSGDAWVYYNLEENRTVSEDELDTEAWHIAFLGTDIRVNGSYEFEDGKFESVVDASELPAAEGSEGATLPTGSGVGWYLYDSSIHMITPVAPRTIVIRTRDERYAKVEILDYYRAVIDENGARPEPRYYSFRYAFQTSGARAF